MAKRMRESRGLGKYDAPLKLQHQMGYSGFKRGRIANPFSEDTMQYREWNRGFSKAFYDNLSRIRNLYVMDQPIGQQIGDNKYLMN